jgi:endonuclease YncB( thermonuclease family)
MMIAKLGRTAVNSAYRGAIVLMLTCSVALGAGRKSNSWEKLSGCRLLPNPANDGDSFHVKHKGKEYLFRLYFVDCPETTDVVPERLKDQAKWWHIEKDAVMPYGREAAVFTREFLKRGFTVFTRYEDARGRSAMKRNFAMVRVRGTFLSEALVEAGLARVYGYARVLPDGRAAKSYRSHLDDIEADARAERKGAWVASGLRPDDADANGRQVSLKRYVALYADDSSVRFLGMLKRGVIVFVPEQPDKSMVKIRAPLHGKVVDGQCRRRELRGSL